LDVKTQERWDEKKRVNMIELDDKWVFEVNNLEVIQCLVDYAFSVIMNGSGNDVQIGIESEFIYFQGTQRYELLAERGPTTICPALGVLHQELKSLEVHKSGILEIVFLNGDKIVVNPDPQYEAWTLNGPDDLLMVCMPGGEIAIWSS